MYLFTIPPNEEIVRDLYSEMAQYLVVVDCELQGRSYLFQNSRYHSQHHLAKLSLSGTHPQARMAARPCCRSFLMASCRQSSGDDLLGH
jgi:hypothetical protein